MSADLAVVHSAASLADIGGGPSRNIPFLCRALADAGARVEIVAVRTGQPTSAAERIVRGKVPIRFVDPLAFASARIPLAPGFGRALRDAAGALRAAVIHDHGLWLPANRSSAREAARLGLPLVVSPRGMLAAWAVRHRAWKKRIAWNLFQRRILESCSALHATAADEARTLARLRLGRPIATVPNAVELPATLPPDAPAPGPRVVLFLSRIHPVKGLLDLVDAWNQLRPAGWRVVIAGPDEEGHRAVVEAAIRDRGLASHFEWLGAVDDEAKWDVYARADLFVLPSRTENFGASIAEALGCGVPVVTTTGTPWGEIVERRCGWWCEPGIGPLTDALRDALARPREQLREMGSRGRELIQMKYTWPAAAERMIHLYRWIRDGGDTPEFVELPRHLRIG